MSARALIALVLSLAAPLPGAAQGPAASSTTPDLALVIRDSLGLLTVEHGVRLAFQSKTRRELSGPFWADYRRSVNIPNSWEDGDGWFVNYIEIGPISEASIGNVGMRPNQIGWVDYVVTPVGGMGLNVAEDALDRFFIEWFERHVDNSAFRAFIRSAFNPARTMANVSAGHLPWYRHGRPLRGNR